MTTQQENQASAPPQTWRYPFAAKGGKEITDPQTVYSAFALMEDGFFPLGVNGFPHGGVHFGAGTSNALEQSAGVRVIANGEIVAFKLDDAYPHIRFTQDHRWGMYSTGFVLVRHKLTMPPAPGSTTAQRADETLTFYSLYMHMADWATYLANGDLVRPGWWPGVDVFRIGDKDRQDKSDANSGARGAFVYKAPKGERVGFLPEGSEVTISENRKGWGHIKAITEGGMLSPVSGGQFGGILSDDENVPWMQPDYGSAPAPTTPDGDWGWIRLHDQRAMKGPQQVGQVVVPAQPIPVTAGTLLGRIGEYHDYERSTPLPPVPARQLLHLEVFAGDELKTFIAKSRARGARLPPEERTILLVQPGAKLVPGEFDPNVTLGQSSGRITLTKETPKSPKAGPWVQIQTYTDNHNFGIHSPTGDPVWIKREDLQAATANANGMTAWRHFPLQLSWAKEPANGTALAFPRAQLDGLGSGAIAADDQGVSWWRIEYGTADGNKSRGWVRGRDTDGTPHPGTSWESPWAWPGFDIVDATGISLTDAFQRNLMVTGGANWKEESKFEPSLKAVNGSTLLQKLEQTVARQPLSRGYNEKPPEKGKHGEEVVTASKLARAMHTPWLASELSHVILRYESEWGGNMARWQALTPLMRNAAENWRCELTRIQKLQWWNDVKGKVAGFPVSPVVNHVHPIALIGNFYGTCFPLDKTLEMAILITQSFEGSNSTTLDYGAVAGNFDGMGMSFGIVQWNFGSGTLAPVLLDMIASDEATFKGCFSSQVTYNSLVSALHSSSGAQIQWAISQQHMSPLSWSQPFKKLGKVNKFDHIQIKHASKYHRHVVKCISWLRTVSPDLMQKIEVQTYCALYDLCVQQQALNSAYTAIKNRTAAEFPKTQNQFLMIVAEERAKTAIPQYRGDCLSRRLGILQQAEFSVPHSPTPITRSNVNFSSLKRIATDYVCEL